MHFYAKMCKYGYINTCQPQKRGNFFRGKGGKTINIFLSLKIRREIRSEYGKILYLLNLSSEYKDI